MTKKKKKNARVKRFDCIPCAKVVVRSISLKLKIENKMLSFKCHIINDQY